MDIYSLAQKELRNYLMLHSSSIKEGSYIDDSMLIHKPLFDLGVIYEKESGKTRDAFNMIEHSLKQALDASTDLVKSINELSNQVTRI